MQTVHSLLGQQKIISSHHQEPLSIFQRTNTWHYNIMHESQIHDSRWSQRILSNSNSACLWQVSPFTFSLVTGFQQDGILMFCFALINTPVGSAHGIPSAWRRENHTVYPELHSNLSPNSHFIKKLSPRAWTKQLSSISSISLSMYSYQSFPNKFISIAILHQMDVLSSLK